jgi:hypothetical protein
LEDRAFTTNFLTIGQNAENARFLRGSTRIYADLRGSTRIYANLRQTTPRAVAPFRPLFHTQWNKFKRGFIKSRRLFHGIPNGNCFHTFSNDTSTMLHHSPTPSSPTQHSITHSSTQSLTHSSTHPLIHSVTHPLIHSSTHHSSLDMTTTLESLFQMDGVPMQPSKESIVPSKRGAHVTLPPDFLRLSRSQAEAVACFCFFVSSDSRIPGIRRNR